MEREDIDFSESQNNLLLTPHSIKEACGIFFHRIIQTSDSQALELFSYGDKYGEIVNYQPGYTRTTTIRYVEDPNDGKLFMVSESILFPGSKQPVRRLFEIPHDFFINQLALFRLTPTSEKRGFEVELDYLHNIQQVLQTFGHP
ncbi:hypothetical protein HYS90_01290 [Candidatus Curtissbacteria bacterium]|nr:hypothetical protein [Candidatus Curtissbacteria bacterium]